jgi:hypothetical protein
MSRFIDIVNFNADASCLSTKDWLRVLDGGENSDFYQWLKLYVTYQKKVNIGIVGASLCDVAFYCPEAIELIKSNSNIFNIMIRPFSHDNALLRSRESFSINLDYGIKVTNHFFKNTSSTFLPPEFMLLSEQIPILKGFGFSSVVVNASRLPDSLQRKVPKDPFLVRGLKFSNLVCYPVIGSLTIAYLNAIHSYNFEKFIKLINMEKTPILWRDGESVFLIPDGVDREKHWLDSEKIERGWVSDLDIKTLDEDSFYTYPAHSFLAWMEEFKMFGYLNKINNIEKNLSKFNLEQLLLWLQTINSDVLSAIEKKDITINLVTRSEKKKISYLIERTNRAFEGEEFLNMLEESILNDRSYIEKFKEESPPHAKKFQSRYEILKKVI